MEISMEKIDVSQLAKEIKERAQSSSNEEEVKIGFAIVLDPILKSWNIKPAYERHASGVRCIVSGVRKDALYGTVILEFKAPGKLRNRRDFEEAREQVKKYIKSEAVTPEYYGRYFGVVTDGFQIAFIRFRKGGWEETEALEINAQTILRLLEAIRGLKRKPIDVRFLLEDFGPESNTSRSSILTLYKALLNSSSHRTQMLFEDWRRVFSQVCAYSKEKLEGLIDYYDLKDHKVIDVEKLMFSIHTYYTILMKLLTSEIVTLFSDSLVGSYLKLLEEAYLKNKLELLYQLKELEEGGIFTELGIKNFLEADYFAWYIDEWNDKIAEMVYKIVEKLLDYEPATVELSPEKVKDLFKRLYQNLVPRDIRHGLGEYFTPDWLAELVLDEVGYDGNPEKTILDPACGSGTFLVLAIKRIKEYAEEHFIDKRTLLTKIVKNVQGIDLNPLAVLAAKANYIIALADLLRYRPREGIELPIYLADSIAVGRRSHLFGEEVYLKTVEGEFSIPKEVIEKGILSKILEDVEFCIKNKYSESDFKKFIQKYEIKEESVTSLTKLYLKLLSLEKEGKNKIWTRILKNSFAPLLIGKFDYVVGNPPWINWEHLPEFYRNETKQLWDNYGLLERTKGMGLGKVKRDMAMLFVTRCLDRFTKDGGKLSFLVPFTVYKTQAGAGFRKFLSKGYWLNENENSPCKVLKIHDLVTLYPFEGAVNRTSLIVIEKSGKTDFPIPCVMWHNPKARGIDQEAELEEVKKITKQFSMVFLPIEKDRPESPWMQMTEKAYEGIKKVIGSSPWYKAYVGVHPALNQVYWIQVLSETPTGVLITNPPLPGQKKEVKQIKMVIEKDLIYPLIRGRNIKKWYIENKLGNILLPVNERGEVLPHSELKLRYPNTYEYFFSFFENLVKREAEPYKSKLKPYREMPFNKAEKCAPPFYWLFNVKPSLAPYKVAWKEIAGKISGKAEFSVVVIKPETNKIIIPDHKVIFVPIDKEEEAYYLSAILNSEIIYTLIAGYAVETAMDIHITQNVLIPKFDSKNKLHSQLSYLSKKAHDLAKRYYEENDLVAKEELKRIEEEINKTVAQLYGITDEELEEIRKCLMILKGGEISEKEDEEEVTLPREESLSISVEPLLVNENESKEVSIKISNHLSGNLKDGKIKVTLKGEVITDQKVEDIRKDEEKTLRFLLPKLKAGQYVLEIIFTFKMNKQTKVVKEERTLFVKPAGRKATKISFEGLDELLGD
jgi:methylase of polypeptide subunit release factors